MTINDAIELHLKDFSDAQKARFKRYYELLTEWNARMNLTAITDPLEVVKKHFLDSILPEGLIEKGASCIDVGTGAGFPGIPLLIARPDISMVLLDALNKRVDFLKAVLVELELDAQCIHARAEDAARLPLYRERFDIALSRAVAPLGVLLEYTMPFVKVGGVSLMYKGPAAKEELISADEALKKLSASAELWEYHPDWGERHVIAAKKLFKTAPAYPRKSAAIKKKPLC